MTGPFFITGTARCGTTQLRQILGEHPEVYSFNWESRFLVDPGGFEDLALALTSRYTPMHSVDALRRVNEFLTQNLTGYAMGMFRGCGLADEIGMDHYMSAVERLWEQLCWFDFEVMSPPLSVRFNRWQYGPAEDRTRRTVLGRYFPDRAEVVGILREFTEEIFGGTARRAGKRTWCEKSPPTNLVAIPWLWELFPESTALCIMRHPVRVVASFIEQPFAPGSLDDVLNLLEPIYRRWIMQRPGLLTDPRYLEVKSEDLADDWPVKRKELFARLGLPDAETSSTFEPEAVHHRNSQLDDKQVAQASNRLGFAVEALGYDPF